MLFICSNLFVINVSNNNLQLQPRQLWTFGMPRRHLRGWKKTTTHSILSRRLDIYVYMCYVVYYDDSILSRWPSIQTLANAILLFAFSVSSTNEWYTLTSVPFKLIILFFEFCLSSRQALTLHGFTVGRFYICNCNITNCNEGFVAEI